MINFYDQVPTIYSNASRDFQYLSWLINIVLNDVKHNVDDMYNLPNSKVDTKLAEVLAMTLGFKIKRNYDQKQLLALVSIIPSLLKYKGTEKAIKMLGDALVATSGAVGSFSYKVIGCLLEACLPKELIDTTLFIDLLPYILPAGMTCRIVRKTHIERALDNIELSYSDKPQAGWYPDLDWDRSSHTSTGLSGLFNPEAGTPEFSNYTKIVEKTESGDEKVNYLLNAGLLDNTVIPAIDPVLYDSVLNDIGEQVEVTRYEKLLDKEGKQLLDKEGKQLYVRRSD
jgi:hypothetical protein